MGKGFSDSVEIKLPSGQRVDFDLHQKELGEGSALASVIKDAGDDPDVTHGAEIIAKVTLTPDHEGLVFKNGPGVGRVTKAGLPLGVGEPAINPVPRKMIEENLQDVLDPYDQPMALEVEISIPGGEELAQKTMNPRLGIIGGLSILGTTGIVVPFSCASWVHAIHRGIDVARAEGLMELAACTGSTSEKSVAALYDFSDSAFIDMGDFVGAVLKYLNKAPVDKLVLGGGFAKLCKFAQGELDLHSSRSRVDFDKLARWLGECGGTDEAVEKARHANTALEVLELSQSLNLNLGELVALRAKEAALAILSHPIEIEVIVVDRAANVVGHV